MKLGYMENGDTWTIDVVLCFVIDSYRYCYCRIHLIPISTMHTVISYYYIT